MKAFVTGGTGGIGQAIVRRLRSAGFDVLFGYCRDTRGCAALEHSTKATGIQTDLGDAEALGALCDRLAGERFDVLVNNAGIAYAGLLQETPEDKIDELLGVNLRAAIRVTRAVLPAMITAKTGRIVQISSVWGVAGGSCETVYSAAKAGLIGFTRALAREVGPSGVTVNAIAPGCIDTPMLAGYDAREKRALAEAAALGRLGTPDDVAAAVMYLAGPDAGFVTGQVLGVDGGFC